MSQSKEQLKIVNQIWEDYQNAKAYQTSVELRTNVPIYVDFYEGRQWPRVTKLTEHMPRPVFNFIEMIINHKKANVLGSKVALNFVAPNDKTATRVFSDFARYQMKEMRMEDLDARALIDGAVKGTYIYYFYWDEKAPGRRGNFEGGLRCQILDPLNVYFANPKEPDEQKQKWIMWEDRLEVNAVKDMADKSIDKTLIEKDGLETPYNSEREQDGTDLCTVITRLFRKDGEVHYERAVKNTVINKPIPLNPKLVEKLEELKKKKEMEKEDNSITPTHDTELEEEDIDAIKFSYYPIVVGSWKIKDKSIYGRGEVETLIPNQKAVNFEIAMQLLNHQELGWGKLLVKPNALNGQEITNTPGEVIVDHTPGANNWWGIKKLEGENFAGAALDFPAKLLDLTRTVTNSSEVLTGDMISKDLSGKAIAYLQEEGGRSTGDLQKAFWRVKEKQGLVLAQFYKLYYEDKDYDFALTEDEIGDLEEQYRQNGLKIDEVPTTKSGKFTGQDYLNIPFDIVVEAGPGSRYSEIMTVDMLNTLFINGNIQNFTSEQLEQYVTLMPDSIMPFKNELRAIIKKQQRSELGQLKVLVEQLQAQLTQLTQQNQEYEKVVNKLGSELKKSDNMITSLQNEYSNKINQVNDYLLAQSGQAPTNKKQTIQR